MPILDATTDRAGVGGILLSTGAGVVFGFQCWQVAQLGLAVSLPWYGLAWITSSQMLLGFLLGASQKRRGWKGVLVLAAIASILCFIGVRALPFDRAAYGVALFAVSISTGLLIAFFADVLCRRSKTHPGACPEKREDPCPAVTTDAVAPVRQRLTNARAALDHLEAERKRLGDLRFGKVVESRIVWRELIELELQDVDEQMNRMCRGADGGLLDAPIIESARRRCL